MMQIFAFSVRYNVAAVVVDGWGGTPTLWVGVDSGKTLPDGEVDTKHALEATRCLRVLAGDQKMDANMAHAIQQALALYGVGAKKGGK